MIGRAVPDDFGQDGLKTSIGLRPKYRQGGQPRRARYENSALNGGAWHPDVMLSSTSWRRAWHPRGKRVL